MVSVAGRITTGSYDNKEGKKVYTTEITADEVNSIGGKKDNQADTNMDSVAQLNDPDFVLMEPGDDLLF